MLPKLREVPVSSTGPALDSFLPNYGREAGNKTPVLTLNHFCSNINLWDPFLINDLVSTGRQLITYDHAGMSHNGGKVDSSINASPKNVIAFLNALLPTLKIEQVGILGHRW